MAEAFPSVILDSVLKQLESPIFWSNKLHIPLHIQLRKLKSKLEIVKEVIDEAELMGVLFPDNVGKWVCELQNLLYEVDDLFDEVLTRSMPAYGMVEKVRLHLYSMSFPLTLSPKIKSINRKLDGIVEECCKCNLLVEKPGGAPHPSDVGEHDKLVARKGILRYDPRYLSDDEFQMIGRGGDKKKVIEMLFEEDPHKVVGIVGRAGMGKTTLCRAVYCDEEVSKHFEIRLWVEGFMEDSSTGFWERIATELGVDGPYYSVTEYSEYSDMNETEPSLAEKICTKLSEGDILLILDDVPIHILYTMENELRSFRSFHTRSKILISSLGDESSTDEILVHKMVDLSEEDMLSLFENTAFGSSCCRRTEEWMRDLGKEIVGRCRGNPSLLKGVATLLCGERDINVWQKFAREFEFESQYRRYSEFCEMFKVLPKYQQNLGYLSLFFEVEFKFDDLIHQFAALGFTRLPNRVREGLEGKLRSSAGTEGTCTVDKVEYRGLILRLAGEESNKLVCTNTTDDQQVARRHVAISSSSVKLQNGKLPEGLIKDANKRRRRSLLFFGEESDSDSAPAVIRVQELSKWLSHLRNLRVLSLQDMRLPDLPSSIAGLVHLKYLDLSGNNFVKLPASVCALPLWTLKLAYCSQLKWFPPQITNLRTLKHLEIGMCFDLIYMPPRIAQLTGLESLDRFVVSSRKGGGLRYLENLNKLSGHLSIELPRRWNGSMEDSKQANLHGKNELASLEFKWHGACHDGDGNDYSVLEQLKPSASIEKLSVFNYGGTTVPGWFTYSRLDNTTVNLTEITLCRCARCKILPPFQSMPKLKCLTLVSLDQIEYIQNDKGNYDALADDVFFPSLRVLRIGKMGKLIGWSRVDGFTIFQEIHTVELWHCRHLMHMPPFQSMPKLECLTLDSLDHIEYILQNDKGNDGASPGDVFFPSLRVLKIGKMDRLEGWSRDMDGLFRFPDIETLEIRDCPSLKHMPRFSRISNSLKLESLSEKLLRSIRWTSCGTLKIKSIKYMVSLPDHFLTHASVAVETKKCFNMQMSGENEAEGIFVKSSKAGLRWQLSRLSVENCSGIYNLFSNLSCAIYFPDSEKFKCYEKSGSFMKKELLKPLRKLKIKGFENMESFPTAFQRLPNLHTLQIIDCKSLARDLKGLEKLKYLYIESCPRLSRSIDAIKGKKPDVEVVLK